MHREISIEFLDLLQRMFEKDPFKRITIKDVKNHPWINYNKRPLYEIQAEKVSISDHEVKSCLKFFQSMQLAKKIGMIWKKKSDKLGVVEDGKYKK